jgi:hypothetical protein
MAESSASCDRTLKVCARLRACENSTKSRFSRWRRGIDTTTSSIARCSAMSSSMVRNLFALPLPYRRLLSQHACIAAKPQVLLVGQYSVGKTSFIRYLLGRDFPGQRIGPEPTTDRFTVLLNGPEERTIPGNALSGTFLPIHHCGQRLRLPIAGTSTSRVAISRYVSWVFRGCGTILTVDLRSNKDWKSLESTSSVEWKAVSFLVVFFDPSP